MDGWRSRDEMTGPFGPPLVRRPGETCRIPDGAAVGPGDGIPVAIGEVHIIGADGIVILEPVNLAAVVFEQVFHRIVCVVFSRFFGDGMLRDAAGHQYQQKDG